jgi:hypothetical protein
VFGGSSDQARYEGQAVMTKHTTWAEAHEFFAERAAIAEFDGGLSRAEAEVQAASELYDLLLDSAEGVVAELYRAMRVKMHPRLASTLKVAGLPTEPGGDWGIDWVTFENETFRPSDRNERGKPSIIVAVRHFAEVLDLVACSLADHTMQTRLGVGDLVGHSALAFAHENCAPLIIFNDLLAWLQADRAGCVIVDWRCLKDQLDGLKIICDDAMANRLHSVTRGNFNPPKIASIKGLRHVA